MKAITPIIQLQRSLKREGKIRLGAKVTGTNRDGREFTRPDKLSEFRFTSANRAALEHLATMYGGEVKPWPEEPGQFELFSESSEIYANLIPGVSMPRIGYEYWTARNCQRRCDGQVCEFAQLSADGQVSIEETECLCQNRDWLMTQLPSKKKDVQGAELEAELAKLQCKGTTRVAVQLAGTLSLGVWTLESHGHYAMTEFAPTVEMFLQLGQQVLCKLAIEQRESKDRAGQLRQFIVPVLRLEQDAAAGLRAIGGVALSDMVASAPPLPSGPPAIETSGRIANAETGEVLAHAQEEEDPFERTVPVPVDPNRQAREVEGAMLDQQVMAVMTQHGMTAAEHKKALTDFKGLCANRQRDWRQELLKGVDKGFTSIAMISAALRAELADGAGQ